VQSGAAGDTRCAETRVQRVDGKVDRSPATRCTLIAPRADAATAVALASETDDLRNISHVRDS